ncbi:MAG: HdeD family acid-resistance protein [Chloroflexi bacterium]|nr:MAG: HdeD family acid-resistance protein [Chloroflexota bacterium]
MKNMMTGEWWVLLVRGILALLFGLAALVYTNATVMVLFIWFILYAVGDGIFHIYMSLVHRHDAPLWWLGALSGVASLVVGIAALVWPALTGFLLLMFIAAKAVIDGVVGIVQAFRLRQEVKGEWLLIAAGLVAVIFGAWMFFQPLAGGLLLLLAIAMYAIVVGVILIVQAFRLKNRVEQSHPGQQPG